MEELLQTSTSYTWADILATKSSDAWFDDLSEFIPREVKAVFGKDRLPTAVELRSLPYHADYAGAYADILTSLPGRDSQCHVYPGMCSHRPVRTRRSDHESSHSLVKYPASPYYLLKHGATKDDFSSRFVSFARIPTEDARLDSATIGHRRMLCRLAEGFFTVWTMSSHESHRLANDLANASSIAIGRAYGDLARVDWSGLATHSPLKEQTGRGDRRTVAKGRYEEAMERFAVLYGGMQFVPDDIEALAKRRSKTDQLDQRRLRDERDKRRAVEDPEGERAAKAQKNEEAKAKRAVETTERKEEKAEYHHAYHINRAAAMTEDDKAADALDKSAATRKSRVSKALAAGILTKAQADAAEANNWYAQPGWPSKWSRAPSKTAQGKGRAGKGKL